jgi:hypothetical protein
MVLGAAAGLDAASQEKEVMTQADQAILDLILKATQPRLQAIWAGCQASLERIERATWKRRT